MVKTSFGEFFGLILCDLGLHKFLQGTHYRSQSDARICRRCDFAQEWVGLDFWEGGKWVRCYPGDVETS